jgi:hypothetical protein
VKYMTSYLRFIVLLVFSAFVAACTSSHIIIGNTRNPTRPEDVKIYFDAPRSYEKIALIDSDSNGSFKFSAQGKVDAALERMKKDAAKLGANGILLQGVGEKGSVSVGTATGVASNGIYSGTGVAVSGGGLIKSVSGLAIWVTEQ